MKFLFQFAKCRRCAYETDVCTTSGSVGREGSVSAGRRTYCYYRARSSGRASGSLPDTGTAGRWRATGCNGQSSQSRSLGANE